GGVLPCVTAPRAAFFCADPATTEIYTLSLHDALPIFGVRGGRRRRLRLGRRVGRRGRAGGVRRLVARRRLRGGRRPGGRRRLRRRRRRVTGLAGAARSVRRPRRPALGGRGVVRGAEGAVRAGVGRAAGGRAGVALLARAVGAQAVVVDALAGRGVHAHVLRRGAGVVAGRG